VLCHQEEIDFLSFGSGRHDITFPCSILSL